MFKGFAHLEKIVQTSSEIASLNFSTNNARVTALLKPSSRKVIREAAPHERKLFTLVEELGTTPREELEQPTPLRGPDPVTVDKILRAANVLAQICNLQDAKEQIEFLAQRHEEITSSIDSLESIMEKQKVNLEKCKIAEQTINLDQVHMGGEASSSRNQMSKIEEDIWHHEKEILALEMIKKEYIKKVNSLDEELIDQKHLEEEEIKLNHRLGMLVLNKDDDFDDMDDSDDIVVSHELAERMQLLEFKKEILAELDTQLEELEEISSRQMYTGDFGHLKFKFQSISKKADMEANEVQSEGKDRIEIILSTLSSKIDQILDDRQKWMSLEFNNHVIKEVNNTLINYVASTLDQSDIDLNVSIPVPSQQAIIAAIILRMVRNAGGEISLADLKDQIGQAVREKGWQERDGINALYLLVANKL
ncbi:10812_t:CDS:10 [Cetraspora pellucida]|uniref:10812_t:CDS:1 n=1 Tax=Cetraspora pellucida TaxID=1433469 RepID=A0A9N9DCT7_9GLOM|nr:10812_t:CDS:10 [Cetraspora pellucida]